MDYLGLTIDLSRDALFDENGLKRLKESYMMEGETSPQQRFAYVSKQFGSNLAHSQRLYEYASKHWLSYATPILSFGKNKRGLPISCMLVNVHDTREGLVDALTETNWLSMLGAGVGLGFNIRSSDDKSVGVIPHLKTYDACSLAYRQGATRRGSYAAYLDISHPDIINFIEMRKGTGDPNLRCPNLHHGVNITDKFMHIIEACMNTPNYDDKWELIDPHTNKVKETVSAKMLWQKILETRMETGEPYLHFIDTSNKQMNQYQKEKGLSIKQSNLCSEIIEVTDKDRTAVCCLSSFNLEHYYDWKDDRNFIPDVVEMLDNVLTYFIENAPDEIKRSKYSAMMERSIGIGVLGFHAFLQKHLIAFESGAARGLNLEIFRHIHEEINIANLQLGYERGSPPDIVGSGRRFTNTMAIAPTASTSIIMGNTSPSVEPYAANAYRQDTLSGFYLAKNKFLDKWLLENTHSLEQYEKAWESIVNNRGSVQHIEWMPKYIRDVFKTSKEIDQMWIIRHAAHRQIFIDQAQSINLFFKPDVQKAYLHKVHFAAWKEGLKTLYYLRPEKIGKSDNVSEQIERNKIEEEECLACQV